MASPAVPASVNVVETDESIAVKEGRVYRAFAEKTLLTGAKDYYKFDTNDVKVVIRDTLFVSLDSPLKVRLYGGSTFTADGDLLQTYNLNSSFPDSSTAHVHENTNPNTLGQLRDVDLVASGSTTGANIATGQILSSDLPRVAVENQTFLVEVENVGPNTANYLVKYVWEEI